MYLISISVSKLYNNDLYGRIPKAENKKKPNFFKFGFSNICCPDYLIRITLSSMSNSQLRFSPMRRTSMMQSIPSEVMNLQVERLSRILLSSTRKET